jgi:phosphatidylinositol 4-kinase
MLSNSPGRNMNWESSPFKLTREYVEVLDGEDSEAFAYFKVGAAIAAIAAAHAGRCL